MENNLEESPKNQCAAFCPACKRARSEWGGEGITLNEISYCCESCMKGTQCTCTLMQSAIILP